MDREVASGWFDSVLIDLDFHFVNDYRNIPMERCDTDPAVQRWFEQNDIETTEEGNLTASSIQSDLFISTVMNSRRPSPRQESMKIGIAGSKHHEEGDNKAKHHTA